LFLTKTLYKGASPPGREAPYIHEFLPKKNIYFSYQNPRKGIFIFLIEIQEKSPKYQNSFSNRNPKKESKKRIQKKNIYFSYRNPRKGIILFLIKIQEKSPKYQNSFSNRNPRE